MFATIELLLILTGGYLIGSIPTGYLLVKMLTGEDIRQFGSGNIGATNVKRRLGTWAFFVVMGLDMVKGFVPVFYVSSLLQHSSGFISSSLLAVLIGLCVVIGNSKSVFLKFKGGKAAATGAGVLFGLCWQVGLSALLLWGLIVAITKYVSLASIITAFSTPILMYVFHQPVSYIVFALIAALYIGLFLHRENIQRLIAGKESKINS